VPPAHHLPHVLDGAVVAAHTGGELAQLAAGGVPGHQAGHRLTWSSSPSVPVANATSAALNAGGLALAGGGLEMAVPAGPAMDPQAAGATAITATPNPATHRRASIWIPLRQASLLFPWHRSSLPSWQRPQPSPV
jgi:hypothetical protein